MKVTVTNKRSSLQTLLVAATPALLNAITFGCTIGYSSPALPDMQKRGLLDATQASWFGSLVNLTAIVGGVIAGWAVEKYGRKTCLLLTSLPFFFGWVSLFFGKTVQLLMIGRGLTGLASGMTIVSSPLYVSEISTKDLRGLLGACMQLGITIGILVVYVLGMYLSYPSLAGSCLFFTISAIASSFYTPESPRWLILKSRKQDAISALTWLREPQADVEDEVRDIEESMDPDDTSVNWKDFLKPELMNPLKVSVGLMVFQQLSGINAVMFYTVSIFEGAGFKNAQSSTVIIGLVQVVATLVACILMDRAGRRLLLLIAGTGMTLACFTFGYYFTAPTLSWLAITSLVVYTIAFSLGWGPIPMLIMSEIFPVRARGSASAVSAMTNWAVSFIITKEFVHMQAFLGQAGTFWLFGFFCLFGVIFVYKTVPETKGKSLEDIELYFLGRAIRGI